jgi:hypothetical protein
METAELASRPARAQTRIAPGVISEGWAFLIYQNKPTCLLGKGDYLTALSFEAPMAIMPVGRLVVENDVTPTDGAQTGFLRSLNRQIVRLSVSSVARTADLLLELLEKICPDEETPLRIDLPLSQSQLAELLGMSAVHMNRVLCHLDALGVVRHAKGTFMILDRVRLAELAADHHV